MNQNNQNVSVFSMFNAQDFAPKLVFAAAVIGGYEVGKFLFRKGREAIEDYQSKKANEKGSNKAA